MTSRARTSQWPRWIFAALVLIGTGIAATYRVPTGPSRIHLLGTGMTRCEPDGDSREALRLEAGQEVTLQVKLPATAALQYAAASASAAMVEPLLRVTVESNTGKGVAEVETTTSPHWTEHRLDLAAQSGHEVVIRARATHGTVCWATPTIVAASGQPTLVLVILLDTFRADHLHLYGYARPTTPALDALAAEAVVFTDAASDVSWTRASVATLMTGQPAMMHGVLQRDASLGDDHPTMAEHFRTRGFRTVAIISNPNVLPAWGFARGFDRVVDVDAGHWLDDSDAARAFAVARETVESAASESLLLYVHINDAHAPYAPPLETARTLVPGYTENTPGRTLGPSSTAEEVAGAIDRYDGEIANVDRQLGELFAFLSAQDLWRTSLVVVAGDHGEEFHDHDGIYHGHTVFREQLHVPLTIKLPGGAGGGTRVAGAVSMVDVLATMLSIIGPPERDLPGRVLVERNGRPREGSSLPRFAITDLEQHTVYAVEDDARTLIVQTRPVERRWLFDRLADPTQAHDIADTDLASRARLQALLDDRLLGRRHGWHVRVCGDAKLPRVLHLQIAPGGATSVERLGLEPEDTLELAADGSTMTLTADLPPRRRGEAQEPDRDEILLPTATSIVLTLDGADVQVVVGRSPKGVHASSVTASLPDAATPAEFVPECPGSPMVFVWHAGSAHILTDVDPALRARLRALGYAH